MFSRKSFDNKKHPYRGKGNRTPKPHEKERVDIFMKEMDEEFNELRKDLEHYFDGLENL